MEAMGTPAIQSTVLYSFTSISHRCDFSWLIKFPFAFYLWEQAENPTHKNLIIHPKIVQLLNKNKFF